MWLLGPAFFWLRTKGPGLKPDSCQALIPWPKGHGSLRTATLKRHG
jgi:hypothetical protein